MKKIILILLIIIIASTLRVDQQLPLSQFRKYHGWNRLKSTTIDEGGLRIDVSIQLQSSRYETTTYQLQFIALNQEQFQHEQNSHCSVNNYMKSINILLNKANGYQTRIFHSNQQKITQKSYLVLRDCHHTMINQYFIQDAILKLSINLTVDQSHFTSQLYFYSVLLPLQLAIIIYLFLETRKIQKHQLQSSDFGPLLTTVIKITFLSVFISIISFVQKCLTGTSYYQLQYYCFFSNLMVEVFLILLLINLNYGWKVNQNEATFASQFIYKVISTLLWFIISSFSLILEQQPTQYSNPISISLPNILKILFLIISMLGLFKLSRTLTNNQRQYYKYVLMITIFYLLSICLINYVIINNKNTIVGIVNLLTLLALSKLLILKNNIFRKVALSKKSFMD